MRLGLIFFGSPPPAGDGDRYGLLVDLARFADRAGLEAVWVPERHFTPEGWLYPNPAVVHAALARETERITLRAGSVVLPLHHPIRVAEEWSVVDNLSGGRVEISFASGWHPADFAFFPERYDRRHEAMWEGIETVRRLWRRESVEVTTGTGERTSVQIFPPPVQPELPFWITAAGNPETFARAGESGAHLLTHLFNQSLEELEERIGRYRGGLARSGLEPDSRRVAVMVHAALGEPGDDEVVAKASEAFRRYLESATGLLEGIAASRGRSLGVEELSEGARRSFAAFWVERMMSSGRVLFGSPEELAGSVRRIARAGVDELALQLDFGLAAEDIRAGLPGVRRLLELCAGLAATAAPGAAPGAAGADGRPPKAPAGPLAAARRRCPRQRDVARFYGDLERRGVSLSGDFRGIEELWTGTGEAAARVTLAGEPGRELDAYHFHPALLDGCLQVALATLPEATADAPELVLPVTLGRFELLAEPGDRLWTHARLRPDPGPGGRWQVDLRLYSVTGEPVARIEGLGIQHRPSAPVEAPRGRFHRLEWRPVALPEPADGPIPPGLWVVLADRGGLGEALAERLEGLGGRCLRVRRGGELHREGDRATVRPSEVEDLAGLLRSESGHLAGIVHCWSLDAPGAAGLDPAALDDEAARACGGVLALARGLEGRRGAGVGLWMVTRGAQSVTGSDAAPAVAQALLWGLGTTLREEVGRPAGGLVDLDPAAPAADQVELLCNWMRAAESAPGGPPGTPPREDRTAFRGGRRFGLRLVEHHPGAGPVRPALPAPGGCALITGGLGELGLATAARLVAAGVRRLVLVGRTGLPPREQWREADAESLDGRRAAAVEGLEAQGAEVRIAALDVADEAALRRLLAELESAGWTPVRVAVHAAGVTVPGSLAELEPAQMAEVLRPKALGAWALHRALDDPGLQALLLFSSWASFLGPVSQGLGSYGAANAFLDALAAARGAAGLPAVSVSWGDWAEIGSRARVLEEGHRLLPGDWTFPPSEGLDALETALGERRPHVAYLAVDWAAWNRLLPLSGGSALLSELVPAEAAPAGAGADRAHCPAAGTRPAPERVAELLGRELGRVLRLSPAELHPDEPLTSLGLDSLLALEVAHRIGAELGGSVSVAELVDGISLAELTRRLERRL